MDAVLTALVEEKIGPGERSKFLVQTAREKIKFDYCLALRSPALALYLALKSLNWEKGQAVIVSALSPLYYERVLRDLGLEIIYCDVSSSTACMSRESLDKAMSLKPKDLEVRCIVLHHTLGYLSDTASIAEPGIPVIEDCSRSYGTTVAENSPDQTVEPATAAATASLFTILGLEERDMLTCGGGALLYSQNRRDSSLLREMGNLPPEFGLPDMNAALAAVQFREAAKNLQKRREIAGFYTQSALRTRHKTIVQQDLQNRTIEYNNYAFPLVLEQGVKEVKAYAKRKDIEVDNAFDNTLISNGLAAPEQCPEAYSLSLRTVLFPIYPRLRISDAEKVAKLIQTLP